MVKNNYLEIIIHYIILMQLFKRLSVILLFMPKMSAYKNMYNKTIKSQLSMKQNIKKEFLYVPKSENQKLYIDSLKQKEDYITVVVGPAGTGKTLLACSVAIDNLKQRNIDKIIITRPVVPVEEEIGFLPGSLVKKMDPWTRPILDIFEEYYTKSEVTNMINNGQIEISPLGFMRGRTFKNAFIIADEMQNSSPNQMFMLLTRIGINSRMVITGDLGQSDKLENNGLKDVLIKFNAANSLKNIMLVKLGAEDIQRSELVQEIIKLYTVKDVVKDVVNPTVSKEYKKNDDNGSSDAALIPRKDMFR